MKAFLGAHDAYKVVEKSLSEPDKATLTQLQKDFLNDPRKKDKKALYLIYQSLNGDRFENISSATSIKIVWN